MKTLNFSNGDKMPAIGLGTWQAEPGEVQKAVITAVKAGYRHIDCAAVYGNEHEIGEALTQLFNEGVVTREELWITSKLWVDSFAPVEVLPALEQTLSDLQLEYLDLYLMHWPLALKKGLEGPEACIDLKDQPLIETWRVLESAVSDGLCRHIGVSNFSVKKLAALTSEARITPEVDQVEMHPYLQQPELVEFCHNNGVHITAYSPLGSSNRPETLSDMELPAVLENAVITEIAEAHQVTPAQVILSFAVHRGISAIPKSVNPERIAQNLAAADLALSDEELARIKALDKHMRYLAGDFWVRRGSYASMAELWDE